MHTVKIKRLNNRGDTIVEVLICIAVLALIVAAAYTLTSRNQITAQQSHERSEALKIANTQLELLRTYAEGRQLGPLSNTYFCITISGAVTSITPIVTTPTPSAASDNFGAYPSQCQDGTSSRYKIAVWGYNNSHFVDADSSGGKNVFAVTVRWDSIKGGVREEVKTFYTTYDATSVSAPSNIPGGAHAGSGTLPENCSNLIDDDLDGLVDSLDVADCPPPAVVSWSANGYPYASCVDPSIGGMCTRNGSSVYSSVGGCCGYPPFKIAYSVTGLTGGGAYTLNLNYSNFANGGMPVPPGYSYNINIKINNVLVAANVALAAQSSGSRTYTATLSLPATPTAIEVEWNNDAYTTDGAGNLTSDANFQLESLRLTKL
jgi:type II secretory pathway pseudopilin PulG